MKALELPPDQALFDGKIQGLVLSFYENERPLQGLAGLMDWHFQGILSKNIRAGVITGKPGECAYVPVQKGDRVYHLILAGAGHTSKNKRAPLPAETLQALQKNLTSLRLNQMGVSRSDFGNVTDDYFTKNLKGLPLWIVH
jgi:hypothetical protein